MKSDWQNIVSSKIHFFGDDIEGLLAILKILMKFAEGEMTGRMSKDPCLNSL